MREVEDVHGYHFHGGEDVDNVYHHAEIGGAEGLPCFI